MEMISLKFHAAPNPGSGLGILHWALSFLESVIGVPGRERDRDDVLVDNDVSRNAHEGPSDRGYQAGSIIEGESRIGARRPAQR